MAICALCKEEGSLRTSHIIPAFVFRWLRETSATGFLRSGQRPQARAQDGLKVPLLCEACEQRFSRLERQFANEVFYPILRGRAIEVAYAEWFLKFCVSISWRVLTHGTHQDFLKGHFKEEHQSASKEALDRWSQFLLGDVKHPARFEQRLVLLDEIQTVPQNSKLQPNSNRYFMRSVDVDLACTPSTAFVFTKIGPFALFGMIQFTERWSGTKVNANHGTIGPRRYELPRAIFDYWMDRAKHHSDTYRKIPVAQQERFEKEILENPERFLNSGTFKAMERDVRLFGKDAFWDRN